MEFHRGKVGTMNRRQAKREACKVVAAMIDDYFNMGQPETDCDEERGGWRPEDAERLREAFREIEVEMLRRSGEDRA